MKDLDNSIDDKIAKLKSGERAAGATIITSFLLALSKAVVGYFAGSVVLMADALHSGADSISGFASWFGLKISQKKPDERFPYGYYKAENLATLVVSGFILYIAFELLLEGYSKLFTLPQLIMPYQALGVAAISSVVSYFLSMYLKKEGEKINSQSLIANAQERRVDILSSAIVFVAILLTFYKVLYVEGIITIIISLLAVKIGISTAKDSIFALMDVSPSKEIEDEIKNILKGIAGIEDFESLKLRKSGPFIFGEINVKIRKYVDVKRAHEIADNIENKIKEAVQQIDSFTIHVEPYETEKQKLALPIKYKKGLDSEVMDYFGRTNYFIFVTINRKTGKIDSSYVKENPHKKELVRAGFKAANFIVKEKIDVLITKEMGGISLHTLRDHLVDVYKAKGKTAGKAIDSFVKGKLERLTKPTKELGEPTETKIKETVIETEKPTERGRRGRRGRWGKREPRWRR